MKTQQHACFVTPGHLSSTPRLVKAAAAAQEAGYKVSIVSGRYMQDLEQYDKECIATHSFDCIRVEYKNGFAYQLSALFERTGRALVKWTKKLPYPLLLQAENRMIARLSAVAAQQSADIYLGHCFAGLPIAAQASKRTGALCAFDAEDYHAGEFPKTTAYDYRRLIRKQIEDRNIPQIAFCTTAAPMITERYRARYSIPIETILNVFPMREAPNDELRTATDLTPAPKLYWFSQTIGPERGLEEFLHCAAKMNLQPEIHLRGFCDSSYRQQLQELAVALNLEKKLHFLESIEPDKVVADCANYHMGLALELDEPEHHAVCLANKIFSYLLAGRPVLLSNTPAQAALAEKLGSAAVLCDLKEPLQSAQKLDGFFASPTKYNSSCELAFQLAQQNYNWDLEKNLFLSLLERSLSNKLAKGAIQ